MVRPLAAVTMSSTRIAPRPIMFSQAPTTVITFSGRPSSAIAAVASRAAAAPDMSYFIPTRAAFGLSV